MSRSAQTIALAIAALGLFCSLFGGSLLSNSNQLATSENPFGLYRSAYGKLLARLGETTIDRIWHLGVEQIVPHYMSGDKAVTSQAPNPDSETASREEVATKPLVESAKAWLQKRVVSQHSRTNPYALTSSHRERIHKDLANLMMRSYRLDPTHYGAYNSYNLFITHHQFGGTEESREHAKSLAENTIHLIENEDEDPEAFLTAASASMNLFLLETEDARIAGSQIELDTLRRFRKQIAGFLDRFETLQTRAEDSGDWDYLSMDRQVEIAHRYRFTKRTFQQFDAMIARYESSEPGEVSTEVAEKNE